MEIFAVLLAGYFFPTIVAICRRTHWGGVFILNLLLGWSGLGWVVALITACSAAPRQRREPAPRPRWVSGRLRDVRVDRLPPPDYDPRWQPGRLRDAYSERREPRF